MASHEISVVQTGIFQDLQRKIDEDTAIKDVGRRQSSYALDTDTKEATSGYCPNPREARHDSLPFRSRRSI